MQSKLLKYGIEVEGEFSSSLVGELNSCDGVRVGTDGSVRTCTGEQKQGFSHRDFSPQEVRIEPLTVDNFEKTAPMFFNALKWGVNFHANNSSGFHIHLSFSPSEPPELLNGDFFRHFLESVRVKFPEEVALRHNNHYCMFEGISKSDKVDDKIKDGTMIRGERYRAINLTALNKHGTIEFRLWPSNDPKKMMEYLRFTINTVRDYIESDHRFVYSLTKRSSMPKGKQIKIAV